MIRIREDNSLQKQSHSFIGVVPRFLLKKNYVIDESTVQFTSKRTSALFI